tara:strand:+ start:22405 stop:22710 length:306 start_codon:yes stop_codon:yes gene_type:complete
MSKIKEKYKASKGANVGDSCICPSCNTTFVKTNYQQAFCKTRSKTKCKDKYWNTVTPGKRNNTTRISPANQAWMDKQEQRREDFDVEDTFHPHDSYSLGQE